MRSLILLAFLVSSAMASTRPVVVKIMDDAIISAAAATQYSTPINIMDLNSFSIQYVAQGVTAVASDTHTGTVGVQVSSDIVGNINNIQNWTTLTKQLHEDSATPSLSITGTATINGVITFDPAPWSWVRFYSTRSTGTMTLDAMMIAK